MGREIDYTKHCKMQLGSYVEAHEDIVVTDNHIPWTVIRIYLVPTGNIQGTLKVFDPTTSVVKKM